MSELTKRLFSSCVLILLIYLSLLSSILLFALIYLVNFFSLVEFYMIFKKIFKNKKLYLFYVAITFFFYLTFFSVIIWTYLIPLNSEKIISITFILLICTLTDIGGFVVGKTIGGKKITKISPKKTYSGVIGSFLLPLIICYLFYNNFIHHFDFNINVFVIIIFVSTISQLGDLIISFLKRKANIKDSGSIIPGHGGVLDRIDGILLGLPIGIILI